MNIKFWKKNEELSAVRLKENNELYMLFLKKFPGLRGYVWSSPKGKNFVLLNDVVKKCVDKTFLNVNLRKWHDNVPEKLKESESWRLSWNKLITTLRLK